MKNKELSRKLKKYGKGFLVFTLIIGMLASTFGVCVMAFTGGGGSDGEGDGGKNNDTDTPASQVYEDPVKQYDDIGNEIQLKDTVNVFTEAESKAFTDSILSIENVKNYGRNLLEIKLAGADNQKIKDSYGDIVYIQGGENSPLGEDRILRIESVYVSGSETIVRTSEPYFEDVFDSLELCATDSLTAENFVRGYYAQGVSSSFGTINDDGSVTMATESKPSVQPLSAKVEQTKASEFVTDKTDLIFEIDYKFKNNDKNAKDNSDGIEKDFGIKGQFGIRDLKAHMVCDMPSVATFEELYFGISGETFVDVDVYGKVSAKAEMEANKTDLWFFTVEGLNAKRFPIAILQFVGSSPVRITSKAFEEGNKSLVPTLYVMVYADWEGKISLELSGGFDYTHSFNGGLRLFKEGQPCLSFENYPYTKAYDVEKEDGFKWNVELALEADTNLTILGGSLLFYVAGVNLAEVSAARIGIEAKCNISLKADSQNGVQWPDITNTNFYIRGYLRIIEAKVKLKAEGKSFLKKLSIDISFEFGLLDITLFESGIRPDKYKPKVPISSKPVPNEFQSVISLVFDVSGSMSSNISTGESKLTAAKNAAKTIVGTTKTWAENNEGNFGIGIVQFADSASLVTIPHIDYPFLEDCIDTMNSGGGTSIYSGIDLGTSQLSAVNADVKVMILMTDGKDYNERGAKDSAKKAAEAGIKIYTIGFGDGVNEDVLKEIASISGGEYKYASTDNIIGITGSFMYAQQSANAKVLGEVQGAVSEGELSEKTTFAVNDSHGTLVLNTAWPGSFLDTILVDPNGRVVDENYPNSVTDESKIPSTIIVNNPIKGTWSVRVKGVECSYENEPFYTIVSFNQAKIEAVNEEMSGLQQAAVYCVAIGLFLTLASAMLLICFKDKKQMGEMPVQNGVSFQ